jgi:hypothetical protein
MDNRGYLEAENRWKEVGEVCELFGKRVMQVPKIAVNGAYVKELGRINKEEEVLKTVMKYQLKFWKTDETNLLGATLGQQRKERGGGGNWMWRIK